MAMPPEMSEDLKKEAQYGRLAFDNFALVRTPPPTSLPHLTSQEHWSNDPSKTSEQKWEELVWEYQKLTLIQRWPYQCLADSESSPVVVDKEEINRIFLNQTIHERNTSLGTSMGIQTIWLRTCYDQTLTAKYNSLERAAGAGISDCMTKVLDDTTRYNFEESWRRILICIPGLTDLYGIVDMDDGSNLQYKSGQDDIELVEQVGGEDEDCRELSLVELRIQAGIYLLDKESIESGFIKVVWIDEHGDCVWDNRLDPVVSDVEGLAGALMNSTSLVEITGYNGTRGALIQR